MSHFLLFILLVPVVLCDNQINRSCILRESHYVQNYSCNPDIDLDTLQIARRYGYHAESHIITTEDGYILTLHRIPGSRSGECGRQPILLQHGLFASSNFWVIADTNSLAFILADAGYDVWMGNSRGNIYSKAHTNLSIHSAQYWNFSFHEMGFYDLPATLYHISNTTNKPGEILYIGHSLGTTIFFVFASTRPQDAKNVKLMVALSPVAYMTNIRSPLRYLKLWVDDIEWLAKYLGFNEFLPSSKILTFLAYDCEVLTNRMEICENVIFTICGLDRGEFNTTLLPMMMAHYPAGSSTKTFIHYAQEIKKDGNFQQFDYGSNGNLIKYGTPTPPQYKVANIKVKTYLVYAANDWLASDIDVMRLSKNLTNNVGLYEVPVNTFNHLDTIFGKHVVKLVFEPVLKVLQNFTEN